MLSSEILRQPGLYPADDLRIAANEMQKFLVCFRAMQAILGNGMVLEGIIESHIRTLIRTAEIVEAR